LERGVRATVRRLFTFAAVLYFSAALAASGFAADRVKGTISKVEGEGRTVVVKTKDGKEVSMSISGSRTKLEGIGDRSEFKVGQKVEAEVDGDAAKRVKVSK
jgi:hypothetical protein